MLTYIGVGSNMGDALDHCRRAIRAIGVDSRSGLLQCSPFYRTEPVGMKDQDWFINAVVAAETSLSPHEFLDFLLGIERRMGRERKERWGPRVIDLDILLFGDEVLDEGGLQTPHPRLHERRFVLIPLRDIAPRLEHPVLHKTIAAILAELEIAEKVLPVLETGQSPCPA